MRTFEVSDVERATEPMHEIPYFHLVSCRLGEPIVDPKVPLARKVEELTSRLSYLVGKSRNLAESKQKLARVLASESALTDEAELESLRKKKKIFQRQIELYSGDLGERLSDPDRHIAELQQQLTDHQQRLADFEVNPPKIPCSIEACSRYHGRLVSQIDDHPVLAALYHCFAEHRPLSLSPDMIWMLICQGVAQHVNCQAEQLRSQFVQHTGKIKIEVRRDDFFKGTRENPWGEVVDQFCLQVKDHLRAAQDLFTPHFSTTGAAERIAAEIVMLDALQSYFCYEFQTLCGIPAITLEGTVEDWEQLAARTEAFAQFDLEWWLASLRPILQEFVAAAKGRNKRSFWKSIYKFESVSGGDVITGWIVAFFPYLKEERGSPFTRNPWLVRGGDALKQLLDGEMTHENYAYGPRLSGFPSGLSRAPFVWLYRQERFDMQLLAGFVGVAQDAVTLALRPEIGWAIHDMSTQNHRQT